MHKTTKQSLALSVTQRDRIEELLAFGTLKYDKELDASLISMGLVESDEDEGVEATQFTTAFYYNTDGSVNQLFIDGYRPPQPTLSIQKAAQDAIAVQNACNLSGIVYSFAQAMKAITEACPRAGTEVWNTHPIAVLYSDKIASLTKSSNFANYSNAFDKCREIVGDIL